MDGSGAGGQSAEGVIPSPLGDGDYPRATDGAEKREA